MGGRCNGDCGWGWRRSCRMSGEGAREAVDKLSNPPSTAPFIRAYAVSPPFPYKHKTSPVKGSMVAGRGRDAATFLLSFLPPSAYLLSPLSPPGLLSLRVTCILLCNLRTAGWRRASFPPQGRAAGTRGGLVGQREVRIVQRSSLSIVVPPSPPPYTFPSPPLSLFPSRFPSPLRTSSIPFNFLLPWPHVRLFSAPACCSHGLSHPPAQPLLLAKASSQSNIEPFSSALSLPLCIRIHLPPSPFFTHSPSPYPCHYAFWLPLPFQTPLLLTLPFPLPIPTPLTPISYPSPDPNPRSASRCHELSCDSHRIHAVPLDWLGVRWASAVITTAHACHCQAGLDITTPPAPPLRGCQASALASSRSTPASPTPTPIPRINRRPPHGFPVLGVIPLFTSNLGAAGMAELRRRCRAASFPVAMLFPTAEQREEEVRGARKVVGWTDTLQRCTPIPLLPSPTTFLSPTSLNFPLAPPGCPTGPSHWHPLPHSPTVFQRKTNLYLATFWPSPSLPTTPPSHQSPFLSHLPHSHLPPFLSFSSLSCSSLSRSSLSLSSLSCSSLSCSSLPRSSLSRSFVPCSPRFDHSSLVPLSLTCPFGPRLAVLLIVSPVLLPAMSRTRFPMLVRVFLSPCRSFSLLSPSNCTAKDKCLKD
ncbi:unnamed protein product [Closterium sp. NIES-65]|nr:unnamed protein product [Closterium sp. NIES-65]